MCVWTYLVQTQRYIYREKYVLQSPRNKASIKLFSSVGPCIHTCTTLKKNTSWASYLIFFSTKQPRGYGQCPHLSRPTLLVLGSWILHMEVKSLVQVAASGRCWSQTHILSLQNPDFHLLHHTSSSHYQLIFSLRRYICLYLPLWSFFFRNKNSLIWVITLDHYFSY